VPHFQSSHAKLTMNSITIASMAKNNAPPALKSIADQATSWFIRLQADDISEYERQRFHNWYHVNPAHKAAYEQAQKFWSALETPAEHVHARINATHRRMIHKRPAPRLAWVSCAFAFMAIIAIQLPGYFQNWQSDYYTHPGECQTVSLQDGSQVTLNTDTAITIEFSEQQRRIHLLRGEAYFKVAHNKARPFIVAADNITARAVGTAFSVNTLDDNIQVAVNEGIVAVNANQQTIQLKASQQATYSHGHLAAESVVIDNALAWRNGQVVFDRQPLAQVIQTINHYRKGAIVVANPALAKRIISGVFKTDDPNAVIAALQNTLHTRALNIAGGIVVLY
jgi:transmembrane sensor